MSVRQSAGEIEADAARWVMRLDREGRSAALEAELQAWADQDPRRAGALLQAEAAWATLDRARLLESKAAAAGPRAAPGRRAVIGAIAALAAAVVFGVVIVHRPETYATGVGEVRRLPLADGSSAAINTTSRLQVDFKARLRRVRLDQGEAWFQVARDAERPFRVDVGRVRVQAIGTAFSVRRVPAGVEVRVTEGRVKVWVDGTSGRTLEVPAGSMSIVADGDVEAAPSTTPAQIDRELAWRSGRIDLAGETLGEAVVAFNRYNARALVVQDRDLAERRLHGVFRLDDPEGFAAGVALSLDAEVEMDTREIRIAPSDRGS